MSVRAKKSLGQHFLTDGGVIARIVAAVGAPDGAPVVEIGPGEGALTADLVRRYPDLIALEVDAEAVGHLRRRFPTLDVRHVDVLDADWRELGRGHDASGVPAGDGPRSPAPGPPSQTLHVVGNLPYYITSPILFALLEARASVARAVVMVQKEVADRIVAGPGSKTFGTLSVYFGLYARAELLLDVPPACFRPPPKVDSAVVTLDFDVPGPDVPFEALQTVVRAAFGKRRKMLRNSLSGVAAAAGVDVPAWAATRRPEALAPEEFVRLVHHFA
ncbi:16S rRNA (adenine(1518)-N(6)/adenine(1519)-N(6))-dimethyltransferase RsmA [Rubrivirga sp. IMCC45206]|uniref:16S rRNA (adenine(1518)-N(6)/adenine(1519)-N(6))- dimethyltransferase RsmA n=1 Tax=Rubrivirga sp. IMCC45206 TaxID=3391614 RepID=UPI00398FFD60